MASTRTPIGSSGSGSLLMVLDSTHVAHDALCRTLAKGLTLKLQNAPRANASVRRAKIPHLGNAEDRTETTCGQAHMPCHEHVVGISRKIGGGGGGNEINAWFPLHLVPQATQLEPTHFTTQPSPESHLSPPRSPWRSDTSIR